MNDLPTEIPPRTPTNELRDLLDLILDRIDRSARCLAAFPAPESSFKGQGRDRYQVLRAAEAAKTWLVGTSVHASADQPEPASVLGDARATLAWTEEELDAHFESALADWVSEQ